MTKQLVRQLDWSVLRPIRARSGLTARLLRIRSWWRWPWQERELLVARDSGMGDVLMVTPLLREAKRRDPRIKTVFFTSRYADLVQGLPFIDEVRPYADRPGSLKETTYGDALPPRAPLPQIMADSAGIRLGDMAPGCIVDPCRKAKWEAAWTAMPRPRIVILRRASAWTPNKDWPDACWTALAEVLGTNATIIEIGDVQADLQPIRTQWYQDLRGQTDLMDLPAICAVADLYVGPVSGPFHIAAATGTRGVVIGGGYEHPDGLPYPGMRFLYTSLPCAPCWLRDPCQYDRACLTAITVAEVEQAVRDMIADDTS